MTTNGHLRYAAAFAALSLLGAFAPPAAADAPGATETTQARCDGEYRYSGGEAQRAARDAAIDRVVSDMNFLVRGIARSRLKKATAIASAMSIAREGDQLVVSIDGRRYAAPLDGKGVEVQNADGDKLTLTHREKGGRIEQTFRSKDGGRKNGLRCDAENKLELNVTVFSPRLPHELKYRLSYRRK